MRVITGQGEVFSLKLASQAMNLENTNYLLEKEIQKRWGVEQQLQFSKERFEDLFYQAISVLDGINAIVYVADMRSYEILYINKYGKQIFGEVIGKKCWQSLQNNQGGPCSFCSNSQLVNEKGQPTGVVTWELQNTRDHKWYFMSDKAILWHDGRLVRLQVAMDISQIKQLESDLKQSIQEKNLLLGEIHHRVKNNLSIVVNLLQLQRFSSAGNNWKSQLFECENRVRTMALVHEQLYNQSDMGNVDAKSYITNLTNSFFESYKSKHDQIQLLITADSFSLSLEKAVPCGLLVNELLTNVFKYAFPDGEKGHAWLSLHLREGNCILEVKDDGVGYPSHENLKKAMGMGLKLISGIAEGQLQGSVEFKGEQGAHCKVSFPL